MRTNWFYPLLFGLLVVAFFPVLHTRGTYDPDSIQILATVDRLFTPELYVQNMIELKNLDLQPIRDLTLAIDRWVELRYDVSTYTLQNFFWWFLCLLLIHRISMREFPILSDDVRALTLLLLAVHPLMAQVVPWGMARKHILSLFFVLLGTRIYLRHFERPTMRSFIGFNVAYLCAVLSQPISLLWPLWAILRSRGKKILVLIPALLIFMFVSLANAHYYQHSPVFRFLYPSKTAAAFDVLPKILATGHYSYQLFFPFRLAFNYELEILYALVGHLILGLIATILFLKLDQKRGLFSWFIFGLLPLSMMLTKAEFVMDVYLLPVLIGTYMMTLFVLQELKSSSKKLQRILIGLILISVFLDVRRSSAWNSARSLAASDFDNRPTCISAFTLMTADYAAGEKSHPDAKDFIERNDCIGQQQETAGNVILLLNFRTNVIFYENDVSLEERLKGLKTYSKFGLYQLFAYVALLIQSNKDVEAKAVLRNELPRWREAHPQQVVSPFITETILPFCLKESLQECVDLARRFKL